MENSAFDLGAWRLQGERLTEVLTKKRSKSVSPQKRVVTRDWASERESDEEYVSQTSAKVEKDILLWRHFAFMETEKLKYRKNHGKERPFHHECIFLWDKKDKKCIARKNAFRNPAFKVHPKVEKWGECSRTPSPRKNEAQSTDSEDDVTAMEAKRPRRLLSRRRESLKCFKNIAHTMADLNDPLH